MLEGNVLVTGGAGFLGRALLARAEREEWDARFTILSRDDAKHAEVQKRWPQVATILADVGTMPVDRMALLMQGFDTVIHAAASKYVDRSEHSAWDTIQTNVEGSRRVAEAAIRARVRRVVGISTDKAVAPLNNYGATKFLMERLFQEASRLSETRFTVVRYGNVGGSTGSVMYLFRRWVEEGKPIRITDERMTRFWMTVNEALDTVLAGLDAQDGTVLIPRCRAATMQDVALAALGYREHAPLPTDGRVEVIGLRPGEKMHESLLTRPESVRARRIPEWQSADSIHGWKWVAVEPPDTLPINDATFEITSAQPPGGWMGPVELREMMEAAEGI